MAWSRKKVDSQLLNNNNEYTKDSNLSIDALNGMVNSGLYSQDFVEHLADTVDVSEAGNVGTPTVTFIASPNATVDTPYKCLKFSNLKGEKGDKGDKGEAGGTVIKSELLTGSGSAMFVRLRDVWDKLYKVVISPSANITANKIVSTITSEGYKYESASGTIATANDVITFYPTLKNTYTTFPYFYFISSQVSNTSVLTYSMEISYSADISCRIGRASQSQNSSGITFTYLTSYATTPSEFESYNVTLYYFE